MLSPNPASTPFSRMLAVGNANDKCVGTGPFIYQSYTTGVSVNFIANPNYWGGAPRFRTLIFDIIPDETTGNQALLTGEVQMIDAVLPSMFSTFAADNNTKVVLQQGISFDYYQLYWF